MSSITVKKMAVLTVVSVALSGCQTWSTSNVELKTHSPGAQAALATTGDKERAALSAEAVLITETDITDRKYRVIGDIEVTVNKTTLFHADQTRDMVNRKLQEEAAGLGADAVVLVRYGTVGVGLFSWGSLDGRGRAVAFVN